MCLVELSVKKDGRGADCIFVRFIGSRVTNSPQINQYMRDTFQPGIISVTSTHFDHVWQGREETSTQWLNEFNAAKRGLYNNVQKKRTFFRW